MMHPFPYINNNIEITKNTWYQSESGIKKVLGELQRCGDQFQEEFISLLNQSN